MSKTKIYLRADGNSELGLGHLMRSLALAQMLKDQFSFHLMTRSQEELVEKICDGICDEISFLDSSRTYKEEANFIGEEILKPKDLLVLDGYNFDFYYQERVKAGGAFLACIDDIFQGQFSADLIINPSGNVSAQSYSAAVATVFACGPRYTLLRPAFLLAARGEHKPISSSMITLCMGGSDPENMTLQTLKQIQPKLDKECVLQIIVGAAYRHRELLDRFLQESPLVHRIYANVDADELVILIQQSAAFVCSASTMASEAASVGTPLFLRKTADNQDEVYRFFLDQGLAKDYCDFELGGSSDAIIEQQKKYFDGLSAQRISRLFEGFVRAQKIELRAATQEDCMLYFNWANDALTRAASFSTAAIPYEDHRRWFEGKLADPLEQLFIGEIEGDQVGQLRFSCQSNEALVGFSIAPEQRGLSLGLHLVRLGLRTMSVEQAHLTTFVGFVKQENLASCEIFRKLGFCEFDAEEYPNTKRFEYGAN